METMEKQKVYHVVIRGNDPKLMPLGRCDGQDVPTNYIPEQLSIIQEEVRGTVEEISPEPLSQEYESSWVEVRYIIAIFFHLFWEYFSRPV